MKDENSYRLPEERKARSGKHFMTLQGTAKRGFGKEFLFDVPLFRRLATRKAASQSHGGIETAHQVVPRRGVKQVKGVLATKYSQAIYRWKASFCERKFL